MTNQEMTPENLTVEQVEALLDEASSAGDCDTARDCAEWLMCDSRYIVDRSTAAARICYVINEARANAKE